MVRTLYGTMGVSVGILNGSLLAWRAVFCILTLFVTLLKVKAEQDATRKSRFKNLKCAARCKRFICESTRGTLLSGLCL